MIDEPLPDGHRWLRVVDRSWDDPLDGSFTQRRGGRWNPPGGWPTVYFNADLAAARANLRRFVARWAFAWEDLRPDRGPDLAVATLPPQQRVADVHTAAGVAAVALPATYPLDEAGVLVQHRVCQAIGKQAHQHGLRGVHCRSAATEDGRHRELAWFPSDDGQAVLVDRVTHDRWYHP